MVTDQAGNRMVIYPENAAYSLDEQALIAILAETGLLGKPESANRFLPGERFLTLVCFLGCSPNVALEPGDDNRPYCRVDIYSSGNNIHCLTGSNTKMPRCPECKTELFATAINEKQQDCHLYDCKACQSRIDLTTLNWRKTAAFAHVWIEIQNIYEAEAVPHDDLLQQLKKHTEQNWKIAYLR